MDHPPVAGPSRARGTAASGSDLRLVNAQDELHVLLESLGLGGDDSDEDDEHDVFVPAFRGTSRDAPMSDTHLALALLAEDARRQRMLERDRELALRLQEEDARPAPRAVTVVPPPARPPLQQAQRAYQNVPHHDLRHQQPAGATGPNATAPANSPSSSSSQTSGGWFSSMLSWITGAGQPASTSSPQGSSASSSRRRRPTGHTCVICQDPIYDVAIPVPQCGHYYDVGCAKDLFTAATTDESLYPPRCCRNEIPLASVRPHMAADAVARFEAKAREFGTQRRVYCAVQTCSAFLGAQTPVPSTTMVAWIASGARRPALYTCPATGCGTRTCSACRARVAIASAHVCGSASDGDAGDAAALAVAERAGWRRCPGCETLVELNMGCYHITCRCRAQFCYLCAAPWKTCTCRQWDEQRLVAAAEERVDAEIAARRGGHHAQNVVPVPPRMPAPRVFGMEAARPAVPALPARPAVPARPTVPARPAVPAVPAVPARPGAPAASQAGAPRQGNLYGHIWGAPRQGGPYGHIRGNMDDDDVPDLEDTAAGARAAVTPRLVQRWGSVDVAPLDDDVPALEDTAAAPAASRTPAAAAARTPALNPVVEPPTRATSWLRAPAVAPALNLTQFGVIGDDVPGLNALRRAPAPVPAPKPSGAAAAVKSATPAKTNAASTTAGGTVKPAASNKGSGSASRASASASATKATGNTAKTPRTWASILVPGEAPVQPATAKAKGKAPMRPTAPAKAQPKVTSPISPADNLPWTPIYPVSSPQSPKTPVQSKARSPPAPTHARRLSSTAGLTREELVRRAVEELRENHDCNHEHWAYRKGGGVCPHCHSTLPLYLFRCKGCQTMACNRCRRNRL